MALASCAPTNPMGATEPALLMRMISVASARKPVSPPDSSHAVSADGDPRSTPAPAERDTPRTSQPSASSCAVRAAPRPLLCPVTTAFMLLLFMKQR